MREQTAVNVECNVIRPTTLDGPQEWAAGDFTKTLSDGSEEPATFEEYAASIGLPKMKGVEIFDQP